MKKRIKKNVKRVFLLIVCLLAFSAIGYIGYKSFAEKDIQIPKTINKTPEEKYPKVSKLSLVATGDGLLHNAVYIDAYDKATDTFDFRDQLVMVKDIVSSYDIAYYNQETLFGGKQTKISNVSGAFQVPGYFSYPYFNSPSEFGDAMIDAGFNMVSLASNHSADCTWNSKECITNTYNYWKSTDALYAGLYDSEESSKNFIIKEKNGIKYTMLNYTSTLNGLNGYVKDDPYLVSTYDEAKVKADIESIQDKVDVIIVAMHWHTGGEYTFTPTEENKKITFYLSSLGVDIVLGTYSHCLQPFDIVNDTVVFYSLGNFISNQGDLVDSIGYKGIVGVLASMDITKTTQKDGTSTITIDNLGADLTYTYNKNHNNYLVIPFSKMTSEYNTNYKSIYEEYSKVLKGLNQNIVIKEIGSNL